jgi:hypothetical protein
VSVLGLALGALLRHTAGAVLAVAAVALLPQLLAPLAGELRGWIAGAGPVTMLQKLAQSSDAAPAVAGGLGAVASPGLAWRPAQPRPQLRGRTRHEQSRDEGSGRSDDGEGGDP